MMLKKIISGGQTGADQAGLFVAKKFGLQTGGTLPCGCRTLDGPRRDLLELYGMVEHKSDSYVPRTIQNVKEADGTIRLAADFGSPGEICTLKAIEKYKKPYFDVDLTDPPNPQEAADWINANQIVTLNVAGNAERTFRGCFFRSQSFLTQLFFTLGLEMTISASEILKALGLEKQKITTMDGVLIEQMKIH